MNKFKTEQDVVKFMNESEEQFSEEFKSGACWLAQMNEEYIAYLLKRISNLQEKINELNGKLYEYDCLYFGAEPPAIKKSRKKSKSALQEEEEREEMLAELENMYGSNPDFDDDDFFGFED